jgi:hypothetical protein
VASALVTADRGDWDTTIEADLSAAEGTTIVIPRTGKPFQVRAAIEHADTFITASGAPRGPTPDCLRGPGRSPITASCRCRSAPSRSSTPDKFVTLLAELAGDDVELVVTVGELNDRAAFGAQPANVHVERWFPLAPLLPHCDAVVCHAGSGTTLAALATGLPLVLVPRGADQFANADACQRAGVARVLLPDAVSSTAVRDAVRAILRPDSTEQERAHCVADEIATVPTATDVAQQLETLVRA